MKRITVFTIAVSLGFVVAWGTTTYAYSQRTFNMMVNSFKRPSEIPEPLENQSTAERVTLGKALFFDPRLSGSNWISCGTCHNPALGWSDGLPTAIGNGMKTLERSTPTILNSAYQRIFMWDGRFRSLEEQALAPIQAALEMNQNLDEAVQELSQVPGYKDLFNKAYPGEGITQNTIAKAIAAFERTIVASEAPFDRWINGDETALNKNAQEGFKLFIGKAQCVRCHQGYNFTDNGFHNIGLRDNHDEGRFKIKPINISKGAFKTPTLRDVVLTPPYMHNGEYKTLEEVVEHYSRGGDDKGNLDPNIQALNLSKAEIRDLVAFMESLTGEQAEFSIPNLP